MPRRHSGTPKKRGHVIAAAEEYISFEIVMDRLKQLILNNKEYYNIVVEGVDYGASIFIKELLNDSLLEIDNESLQTHARTNPFLDINKIFNEVFINNNILKQSELSNLNESALNDIISGKNNAHLELILHMLNSQLNQYVNFKSEEEMLKYTQNANRARLGLPSNNGVEEPVVPKKGLVRQLVNKARNCIGKLCPGSGRRPTGGTRKQRRPHKQRAHTRRRL